VTAGTTAQVLIDGRVAGTTPLAVRLPPGIYRVKVLERGSTTYSPTRWITVEAGKRAAAAF